MKKFISLLIITLGLLIPIPIFAEQPNINAEHAIAVEASTGKILYEKSSNQLAGIASVTKLLTIYLTYQAIDQGKLSWDDMVTISDYPYELTQNSIISNPNLDKRLYSVRDLVNISMVSSANSAAIALAEKIGGSEPKFVNLMKKKLEDWGIKDYKIVNASGLNNSFLGDHIYPGSGKEDENYLSAKSVAIIARHLINDYPQILTISSQSHLNFDNQNLESSNKMLPGMTLARQGVDGLKTGTTDIAGQTFVSTSKIGNFRVITVILKAGNTENDENARFTETNKLLDYCYNQYQVKILPANSIVTKATVKNGMRKTIKLKTKDELYLVIKKNQKIHYLTQIFGKQEQLKAPIKKNKKVGSISLKESLSQKKEYLSKKPTVYLYPTQQVNNDFISLIKSLLTS